MVSGGYKNCSAGYKLNRNSTEAGGTTNALHVYQVCLTRQVIKSYCLICGWFLCVSLGRTDGQMDTWMDGFNDNGFYLIQAHVWRRYMPRRCGGTLKSTGDCTVLSGPGERSNLLVGQLWDWDQWTTGSSGWPWPISDRLSFGSRLDVEARSMGGSRKAS